MRPLDAFELGCEFSKLTRQDLYDGRDVGRIVDQRAELADGWPEMGKLPHSIQEHNWNQYPDAGSALVELWRQIRNLLEDDYS